MDKETLKNTISDVLTSVLKNKYIVKTIDNIYEWNVSELITYLTANKIKEIHLFNNLQTNNLKLYTGKE